VDLGGRALASALAEAGRDGDVLVVDWDVDALERLRGECRSPNVFFLLGDGDVLPLPDRSVDAVVGGTGEDVERVLRRT
jgi:ubiquinone/menaquinone biosynthesis C-methylase UbiE